MGNVDLKELYVGVVAGVRFYEHPTRGDESPLMVLRDGRLVPSPYWELPTLDELGDSL